jgi:hypothetical protein
MDGRRFDRISKLFAQRRALVQEANPPLPERPVPELLFVQSFRAGAIAPIADADGRYTLTLEAGSGQTVHFSDRPDRVVGATPTPVFFDKLGFPDDNPPNAALVFEAAPGDVDVAVVELFSPVYDETTGGVTYEVVPLANWREELGVGLQEAPADLATLAPSLGTTHLFIDGAYDCPDANIACHAYGSDQVVGTIRGSWFNNFCARFLKTGGTAPVKFCVPCGTPKNVLWDEQNRNANLKNVWAYWGSVCNETIPACNGNCRPSGWCEPDPYGQTPCPNYY